MIDIHCHILPGIDDGPADIATSIAMARIAVADGISAIIATPHLNNRIYDPAAVTDRVRELNEALRQAGIALDILPGADVSAMLEPEQLQPFTLNRTRYILTEFPHTYLPGNAREILFDLCLRGFWPIITHPERNAAVVENPDRLCDLLGGTIYVQLTAGSLAGEFGPQCEACALYLLSRGVVDFLATDAHSPAYRPPVLSHGLAVARRVVGKAKAMALVTDNPAAVVAGEPLHG